MAGLDGVLRVPPEETLAEWWRLVRRLVVVALGTALRRGELLALRWQDVAMLEGRLSVKQSFVRGEFTTPKSRTSRRTIELGPQMQAALGEQWEASRYRGDDDLVFGHPALGSPLDASKLSCDYMRPALKRAKIEKPFRPWHDLRHTALTHEAAAGNPQAYVQHKAGHSQGSITERYIHAAQVLFPGAAEKGEARLFGEVVT
jgi:integrase